jgi:glycosyltransferase involved in cell wall biosynthesis
MTSLAIGLPVYNGAKTLAHSLDNLLAQTHRDFVLLISDNASTDATAEICAEYARRDARIRYFRQEKNLVWNEHFRFLLMQARTPYFMWATYDDIWLPRFAEANIAELEGHPEAVCCVSKVAYFEIGGPDKVAPDTGAITGTPGQRIAYFFRTIESCGRLYGVYRTKALQESFPPGMLMYAADWLVVALTFLHGDHLEVDEVLLRREASWPHGHYHQAVGRGAAWSPRWFEKFFPLHRLRRGLRERLPEAVWKEVRGSLAYLELRALAAVPEAYFPALHPVLTPLRRMAAKLTHGRWRRVGRV